MSRISQNIQFKQICLKLPSSTHETLVALAHETERTMTEVVRISLGFANLALQEEAKGNSLAIIDKNGKVIKELMVIK